MTVKGFLVKFVGHYQRTGQSPLSQKWSGGGIHRAPKAGGIISAGVRRSPLRFFIKFCALLYASLWGFMCQGLDFSRFGVQSVIILTRTLQYFKMTGYINIVMPCCFGNH